MGDLSPVLQAFLSGQQGQSDLMTKATAAKQRQQQLDDVMKRFAVESKQKEKELELQNQIFELHHNVAQQDAARQIIEQLRQSPETAPGTTTLQAPGINMANMGLAAAMKVPGQGNLAIARGAPGPDIPGMPRQVVTPPAPGTPISIPSAFGDLSMLMPKSANQQAVEQQTALEPGKTREYMATIGREKESQYRTQMAMKDAQLEVQKQLNEIRSKGIDENNSTKLLVAELMGQTKARDQMMAAGVNPDPAVEAQEIAKYQQLYGTGKITQSQLQLLGPLRVRKIQNSLNDRGWQAPPDKLGANVSDVTSAANRLMNDYANINQDSPASPGRPGRVVNKLSAFNPFGDTGQAFKLFESNVAALAKQTGESPSMARSVALAKMAYNAAPSPADSPETRTNKEIRLADLSLTKVSDQIQQIKNPEQRIEIWRDAINQMPSIRQNVKYLPVVKKILTTGTYDSQWLNSLR